MYSRSYYGEGEPLVNLPDNYGGEAFSDGECAHAGDDVADCEECASTSATTRPPSALGGFLGSLGLPFLDRIGMPRIGSEELLIIAAAAFLFLSKDGDRECAVMLLLLLFIR